MGSADDAEPPSLDSQIERLVFEGGIAIYRSGTGFFTHIQSKAGPVVVSPSELRQAGLRPLLATLRLPAGVPLSLILDGKGQAAKRFSAMAMFQRHGFHAAALEYLSGAILYHLEALTRNYETVRDKFKDDAVIPGAPMGREALFSSHPEPYFEFDALIAAARRAYDACRYVLWKACGPSTTSLPRSFSRTVPLCMKLDARVRDDLVDSWDRWGARLTEYRDCIHHYVPIDFGLTTMFMKEALPGVWAASARIPDNPDARSKSAFRFAGRLDALSFGWEVANEVHRVMEVIIRVAFTEDAAA